MLRLVNNAWPNNQVTTVLLFSSSPFNDLCSCCKFKFGLVPSVDLHSVMKIGLSRFCPNISKNVLKRFSLLIDFT